MRYGILIYCVLLSALVLTGCARFPASPTGSTAPARTLLSEITVLGEINPSYYYFLAIDTDDDDGDGPIPIVTGSELGNGWGTISGLGPNDPILEPQFYVMYHDGTFAMFRDGFFIGQPFRGEVTADRKTMLVEIDQASLVPTGAALPTTIQLNWITDEMIVTPPQLIGVRKEYDGFGASGNSYLFDLPLDVTQTFESGVGVAQEELPRDTTVIDDIDMTHWRVEVRIRTL